jgi:hypothetical protein
MLDNKVIFLFYAAAVACFVLAAVQSSGRSGIGAKGAMSRIALLPLGLAFYVFPQMWNAGAAGF